MEAAVILTILDLETTGLDASKDVPVEIAWATYCTDHHAVIEARSMLVDEGRRDNSAEAEKVHGIPSAMICGHGTDWIDARNDVTHAALVTGWNVEFDLSFFDGVQIPHFDAMDITWPKPSTSRSLVATALAHDVAVTDAHRALSDVLLLARLFRRVQELGHDLPAMIAEAMRPRVTIMVAETGYDPKRNEAAKAAGFRWDGEAKRWTKRVVQNDATTYPFAVRQVSPCPSDMQHSQKGNHHHGE
jgi:DNA polymerase III epsilon subunit-like protein